MTNRPEIKVYPVVEFYSPPRWGHAAGNQSADTSSRQEKNRRSPDEDRYLRGLVGKSVRVHTSSAGQLRGVLEAVLSEAIILRTERGQVLIHDWTIVAIETE